MNVFCCRNVDEESPVHVRSRKHISTYTLKIKQLLLITLIIKISEVFKFVFVWKKQTNKSIILSLEAFKVCQPYVLEGKFVCKHWFTINNYRGTYSWTNMQVFKKCLTIPYHQKFTNVQMYKSNLYSVSLQYTEND